MNKFLKSTLIIGLVLQPLEGEAGFFQDSYQEDHIGLFCGLAAGTLTAYTLHRSLFPKDPRKALLKDPETPPEKNQPETSQQAKPSLPSNATSPLSKGEAHRLSATSKEETLFRKLAKMTVASLGVGIITAYGIRELLRAYTRRRGEKGGLHQAAYEGNLEEVKRFINSGTDVNSRDSEGETALHKTVIFPASYKADIHIKPEIVKFFIKLGADLTARCPQGETAFYKAFHQRDRELAQILLEAGADYKIIEVIDGSTALSQAIFQKKLRNLEIIKALLKAGADPKEKDDRGKTLLFRIMASGLYEAEIVQALLDAGASPYEKEGKKRRSPLFKAVSLPVPNGEILSLLLKRRSIWEFKDIPITAETLKILIQAGVKVNAQCARAKRVLHRAALYQGDTELVQILLKGGADPEEKDDQGKTLLFKVIAKRPYEIEIIRALLDAGASPYEGCGKKWKSPLLKAVSSPSPNLEIISLLMTQKARAGDFWGVHKGVTLFQHVCRLGEDRFICYLLSHPRFNFSPRDASYLLKQGKEDLFDSFNTWKFIDLQNPIVFLIQERAYKAARKCKAPLNLGIREYITSLTLRTVEEIKIISWLWKKGSTLEVEEVLEAGYNGIGQEIAQLMKAHPGTPGSAWSRAREKILQKEEYWLLLDPPSLQEELRKTYLNRCAYVIKPYKEIIEESLGENFLRELKQCRRKNFFLKDLKTLAAAALQPSPKLNLLPVDVLPIVMTVTSSEEVYKRVRERMIK